MQETICQVGKNIPIKRISVKNHRGIVNILISILLMIFLIYIIKIILIVHMTTGMKYVIVKQTTAEIVSIKMNENLKKETLICLNNHYSRYKIGVLSKEIINLPEYLYPLPTIVLDISEDFTFPTNIQFYKKSFHITGTFDNIIYELEIPYKNLLGIYDYDVTEGIAFVPTAPTVPTTPKKTKPNLRLVK